MEDRESGKTVLKGIGFLEGESWKESTMETVVSFGHLPKDNRETTVSFGRRQKDDRETAASFGRWPKDKR